jgi:uncharacterized protein
MKKILAALAFLSGLYNASPAAAKSDSLAHTLLWKITGNGLKEPSYLYGTMHTGDDRVFTLSDSTLIAFDQVHSFAMEINMDSVDKMAMSQVMMMTDGTTLKSLLGDADYKLASKYFAKRTGYPLFLFNAVKPIYIYAMMLEGKQKKKDDVLDLYYFKLAKKQNKNIIGLEKAESQMALLDGIPIDKQVAMLREGIHNFKAFTKQMESGTDDYASGDLNKLLEETREHVMHSGSSVFTAVGAAHLPGDKGIISLLKQDGFTVSPVISNKFLKPKEVKKKLK